MIRRALLSSRLRGSTAAFRDRSVRTEAASLSNIVSLGTNRQERFRSSTSSTSEGEESASFDDTMDKLFQEQTEVASDTLTSVATWDPTWYNVADQAVNAINLFHDVSGVSYAVSIIGVTCIVRVFMFPVFVKTQQNSSRMAHMQPEMQALKAKMDALGKNMDQETQVKYGLQMKALFEKYDCNPFRAMFLPFIQAPLFLGMFFGIRKMPDYFAEGLASGGILWFPDLTIPDPYYILPLGSAATFLVSIELGKEQMMASNPQQGQVFVNVFRLMSIMMLPVISGFSAALNCYWVTNNLITMAQSSAFRVPSIRKVLGIWEPPKPVPGSPEPKGIVETIQGALKKEPTEADKIAAHNQAIENKKKLGATSRGPYRQKRSRRK